MTAWGKCWAVLAVALGACGASQAGPTLYPGDPDAEASLASLPDLGEGASGDTDRVHEAMVFARGVFDASLPQPPTDRSLDVLQAWVDRDVVGWLQARREAVDQTDYHFRGHQPSTAGELIVHQAVLGLLHEDTARALEQIPAPAELDSEPQIAQMYRDIVATHARPFVVAALEAYRRCANTAFDGPDDMRHWAAYCDGRFRRMRAKIPKPPGQRPQ